MKRLFVEADMLNQWSMPHSIHEQFGDHGMGLLLTMARDAGYPFDVLSLKAMHSWGEFRMVVKGYDLLAMNVRSWRYIYAKRAAEIFKAVNPNSQVWAGGMHATVAPEEMAAVPEFDVIISREAEATWLDLLQQGGSNDRIVSGESVDDLDSLPFVDRELWPRTPGDEWPLEGPGGWGPGPRALSMITGRRCPWHCHFCYPAEANHFGKSRRRSVGHVISEMVEAEERWGSFGTVIFHDSEFLMNRRWLEEFIARYPSETPAWPIWASCRVDMMTKWPDLVKALREECHWHCFSIGLESGSQKVLDTMNKGTTVEQNVAAIAMVNRMTDNAQANRGHPPVIFANVMLATPGETPKDAIATMRMLGTIKRVIPSISFFTPYPGSVLGDRIIAEGRSLDAHKNYLRFPNEAKVKGVDYSFYARLMQGQFDREIGYSVPQMLLSQGSSGDALG